MSAVRQPHSSAAADKRFRSQTPPLNNGDHLNRFEFERRYESQPEINKAELIEGMVYMPSPVRVEQHGEPHGHILTWLGVYRAYTPGVRLADNPTLRLDLDNEPQPDAVLWIEQSQGGRARIAADDYLEGAPELIVEIAASSAAYDLYDKRSAYRRNGVQEYLILLTCERQTIWYALQDGDYQPLAADAEQILRSRVFPGLWLSSLRFWENDLAGVLAVLQEGLNSTDHQKFAAGLRDNEA